MAPTDNSIAEKVMNGARLPAALIFFLRWLAHPLAVGSITPSGPGLQKLVQKHTKCGSDEIVVEFGAGTGPITKAFLEMGIPGDRLYSFEIDDQMAEFLRGHFPDVNIVHGDCRQVDKHIPAEFIGKVGTLLVGIPMLTLPMAVQKEVVAAIFRVLPKGGRFILYTYSLVSPLNRDALGLKGERLGSTFGNIPPASVWAYWKA
jgi:phosphatidylethanolamine/phosphatidyl-N-methylethanolamine N-methyltransferase